MKIPDKAQLMFEGRIFSFYQWTQELFDGSTTTFEMIKRNPSAHTIATVGDKIIIVRQRQPSVNYWYYSLPGGRVDPGEDSLQAAKRELLEETGYSSDIINEGWKFEGQTKIDYLESIFIAKDCIKITEQKLDAGEKLEVLFLSFEEFLQLIRRNDFHLSPIFKIEFYEAMLDPIKKKRLFEKIFY